MISVTVSELAPGPLGHDSQLKCHYLEPSGDSKRGSSNKRAQSPGPRSPATRTVIVRVAEFDIMAFTCQPFKVRLGMQCDSGPWAWLDLIHSVTLTFKLDPFIIHFLQPSRGDLKRRG